MEQNLQECIPPSGWLIRSANTMAFILGKSALAVKAVLPYRKPYFVDATIKRNLD
jgi:hypothetical protein